MPDADAASVKPATVPSRQQSEGHAEDNHLQAALHKLRQNLATYVLGSFLLAWCLTGTVAHQDSTPAGCDSWVTGKRLLRTWPG